MRESNMLGTVEKLMLAGLGAMSMTRERAEKIFDEYVRRGEAAKADRSGFITELVDAAAKGRQDIEKLVADHVGQTIGKLKLATREDLKRVEDKLDQVLKRE